MIEPTRFDPNTKSLVVSQTQSNDNQRFIRSYDINLKSEEFEQVINDLVAKHDIDEIVETGTFNGLGSTTIFAKTKKYVFSVECNYNNFVTSTQNLAQYDNVCVLHGLSIKREKMISALLSDDFTFETTYDSQYPKTFYMREIAQGVPMDNFLDLFANNTNKQIVFLDSAGGVGYCEFKHFIEYSEEVLKNKILVLDDVDHIKHVRSVAELREMGYVVNISKNNRFAWCDLSTKNN